MVQFKPRMYRRGPVSRALSAAGLGVLAFSLATVAGDEVLPDLDK